MSSPRQDIPEPRPQQTPASDGSVVPLYGGAHQHLDASMEHEIAVGQPANAAHASTGQKVHRRHRLRALRIDRDLPLPDPNVRTRHGQSALTGSRRGPKAPDSDCANSRQIPRELEFRYPDPHGASATLTGHAA
jgi:hypothetical protein